MEEQEKYFDDNYEVLQYYELISAKGVYLGDRSDKKCRFCGKTEPETSFNKTTHAVPEMVGNNSLFANDECDNCSEKFSKSLEDDFVKFINPYRTIESINGSAAISNYKAKQDKSRLDYSDGQLFVTNHLNEELIELDHENNEIVLKTPQEPYCPLSVYKYLAKMGLSIIPNSLSNNFSTTIAWINDLEHEITEFNFRPLLCLTSFTPGFIPIKKPFVYLFKRKNSDKPVPYMQFIIGFGNTVFQIFLPYAKPEIGKEIPLTMNHFPVKSCLAEKYGGTIYGKLDLSSKEIKRESGVGISIGYSQRVRNKIDR